MGSRATVRRRPTAVMGLAQSSTGDALLGAGASSDAYEKLQDNDTNLEMSTVNGEAIPLESDSTTSSSDLEIITDGHETRLLEVEDNDDSDQEDSDLLVVETKAPDPESFLSITLQIFFPFLVAGLGMVGAGLVLDVVQHWPVFQVVSELFILVPALLGLKGNLEMTLASRLSTHANLGRLDAPGEARSLVLSNLALVQCQAIAVALLASLFAIIMDWVTEGVFDPDHALLLCVASLVTASIASLCLGGVMVLVIVGSRRLRVNPDNVATPIAASLGDLTTLALLSWIASVLYADLERDKWLAPVIMSAYLVIMPLCAYASARNSHTAKVLRSGWTPVLAAMIISSLGGVILDRAVSRFDGIAVYQPVINGVGGNLVAVQASRISTHLHALSPLGELPPGETRVCVNPCAIFFGGPHSRTARILLAMVVPGHLLFNLAIYLIEAGHTSPTALFLTIYSAAALVQVWVLLHTANCLIHWFWKLSIDPDNSAIPYLTALGDLLGGGLLWLAFELLYRLGDGDKDVGD